LRYYNASQEQEFNGAFGLSIARIFRHPDRLAILARMVDHLRFNAFVRQEIHTA